MCVNRQALELMSAQAILGKSCIAVTQHRRESAQDSLKEFDPVTHCDLCYQLSISAVADRIGR